MFMVILIFTTMVSTMYQLYKMITMYQLIIAILAILTKMSMAILSTSTADLEKVAKELLENLERWILKMRKSSLEEEEKYNFLQ